MARGVNKAILIGNLGQDPEVRYTPSGSAVCNVPLATTESWKDRESGERRERTEWHRLVFFGRLAEITAEYLRKGSQAYVEGRMQTRKWQDQSGADRYTTEVVVSEMHILGNRNDSGNRGDVARYDNHQQYDDKGGRGGGRPAQQHSQHGGQRGGQHGGQHGGQPGNQRGQAAAAAPAAAQPAAAQGGDDFDDDIPF